MTDVIVIAPIQEGPLVIVIITRIKNTSQLINYAEAKMTIQILETIQGPILWVLKLSPQS